MEKYTRDNGKIPKNTEEEKWDGEMVDNMKENMKKIRDMVMVYFYGRMVINLGVIGKMEHNKERENLLTQKIRYKKVIGIRVNLYKNICE